MTPTLRFTHEQPHISAALILGGAFGQFSDPLDWLADAYKLGTKVDRQTLMESLSYNKGKNGGAPIGEARGLDKRTNFSIRVAGTCSNKLVAMCEISFDPMKLTLRDVENYSIDIVTAFPERVLGVQATAGDRYHVLPGIENSAAISRLMPMNVFNRFFFQDQLAYFGADDKLHVVEAGDAAVVLLTQNWKFYDVPLKRRKKPSIQKFLPFFK